MAGPLTCLAASPQVSKLGARLMAWITHMLQHDAWEEDAG